MLSKDLEISLHRALDHANDLKHEFATLEHLLLALTEDKDAIAVLEACGVNVDELSQILKSHIEDDLQYLVSQLMETGGMVTDREMENFLANKIPKHTYAGTTTTCARAKQRQRDGEQQRAP